MGSVLRLTPIFLVLAAGVAPAAAQEVAQAAAPATEVDRRIYRSPQNFAIELRVGPYRPNVDGEFSNLPADQRPFASYFGNDRHLMFGAEVDYQFFKDAGTLAVGGGISYLSQQGKAFIEPAAGQPASVRSGDATELFIVPVSLSLIYRFDLAARFWSIPLVPYAKAGLDWVYWSVSDGNDRISDPDDGSRGRGGTLGFHMAAGLSLMLDVFDPGAAQALDAEIGVNHTHIFIEYAHFAIDGLGRSGQMKLGDTSWVAGLMFEF